MDMERDEWKVEFSWVTAHAGQRGNELADRLAKEASSSKDIEECYNRIPKSTVTSELKEVSQTVAKRMGNKNKMSDNKILLPQDRRQTAAEN